MSGDDLLFKLQSLFTTLTRNASKGKNSERPNDHLMFTTAVEASNEADPLAKIFWAKFLDLSQFVWIWAKLQGN